MGPVPRSKTLILEQEAVAVAFRKRTLLPLNDCLYSLQATIPHLIRSALHRCFQRHGISRLADLREKSQRVAKKKFRSYPIGYFHIDLTEVRTAQGKLQLFVAIDRTSKFAFARLVERTDRRAAANFLGFTGASSLAGQSGSRRRVPGNADVRGIDIEDHGPFQIRGVGAGAVMMNP